MFGNMKETMLQMQQQMEVVKKRLNTIEVRGEAEGIIVKINGNRSITDIHIPEDFMDDKEALEDLLLTACNRAIEQAGVVNDSEMASSAQGILPNIPGFGK